MPFMFYSTVTLGLLCFDALKQTESERLSWQSILWLVILFTASWSGILYGFLERIGHWYE